MNNSKRNRIYIVFLAIVIPIALFFVIFPVVMSKIRYKNYSMDYNEVLHHENYLVKFSDAVYISDTKQFAFVFSSKRTDKYSNSNCKKPYISELISIDKKENRQSFKDGFEEKKRNKTSKYVIVNSVEYTFRYVEIYADFVIPEYRDEPTYDEFGDEIPGEFHEKEVYRMFCRVDKADIKVITSEGSAKYFVEKKDDGDELTEQTESESDDTSHEYVEVEITTATRNTTVPPYTFTTPATIKSSSQSSSSDINSSESDTSSVETTRRNNGGGGGNGGGNGGGGNGGGQNTTTTMTAPPETTEPTTTEPATTTKKEITKPPRTTTPAPATTTPEPTTLPQIHPDTIRIESDFEGNLVKVSIGGETILKAIVLPENASNRAVKWTSNKPEIAVVDENGKVKAVGKGKAIITAETIDGGLKASCMVTVD